MENDETTDKTIPDETLFDSIEKAEGFDILEHVLSSSYGKGLISTLPDNEVPSVIKEVQQITEGYQNIFDFVQKALSDPDTRYKFLEVARQKFNG